MASHTILLDGTARKQGGLTSGNVTPGMLVEPTGTGRAWKAHDSAGAAGIAAFAEPQWELDNSTIDTVIATGKDFTVVFPAKGAKVNAVTDNTIARGTFVQSAGDGKVEAYDSGVIIGIADGASDLSGDVGRIAIIII